MGIQRKEKGALLKGRGKQVVDNMCQEIEEDLAQQLLNEVKTRLHGNLKHPTGYYESRVQTSNQGDLVEVTDGGVVYGPWLEGTGSRNSKTRFKGYHTFRETTQAMDKKAGNEADRVVSKGMGKLS